MKNESLPRIVDMINPTLQALRELGGGATHNEMRDAVAQIMELDAAQLQATFTRQSKEVRRIDNRLDWVKVYLGTTGYIERQDSGLWALADKGGRQVMVDAQEIIDRARAIHQG